MNEQNIQKLYSDFPALFPEEFRLYGITCGDGWFPLVYQLAADVTAEAECQGLPAESWPKFTQIKQKFGRLRTYMEEPVPEGGMAVLGPLRIHDVGEDGRATPALATPSADETAFSRLIRQAEEQSAVTCEQCGMPGELRPRVWLVTLCESCHKATGA